MVQIVEQLVELVPILEAGSLGDEFVVGVVEATVEASEHAGDRQVILVVSVECRWVEYHCTQEQSWSLFSIVGT